VGRYIRYWYTYRTVVAVLLALVLSGVMYWLYTQQLACDSRVGACLVNVAVHPEDRFGFQTNPDPNVIIVGIDNQSVKDVGTYPVPRSVYAQALINLEKAGAAVVAFDIVFPDKRDPLTDKAFADALATTTVPVVLAYAGDNTINGDGKILQTSPTTNPPGIDQIPLRMFRCADTSTDPTAPCKQPYRNVVLASSDIQPDADGVTRRIPMFVQPACATTGACDTPVIDTLGFAAFRAWSLVGLTGADLTESNGQASFGSAWTKTLPVDETGSALINYFGPPGNYKQGGQFISFGDVFAGRFPVDKVKGRIVLVGYYNLTSVNDNVRATTSAGAGQGSGASMAGIEMHANVVQTLLPPSLSKTSKAPIVGPIVNFFIKAVPNFLAPEPALMVFLVLLVLAIVTALAVARMAVLVGLLVTAVALVVFTFTMSFFSFNNGFVPDLFHPLLVMALAYAGVTAYRILYEDREKRKVTALFGHYLKPEIVAQLAKTRGGVDDILRGGERRDITLLFVDVRGFTSMSERMEADEVVNVVQMYLDHLSGIIFTWDGTVDKYVGDEIVAFWNAPRLQQNHALLAVRCAYDLINRAPELQQRLLEKGLPPIRWGIGINTGPAVVGNMGSRSRLQYTALGDTVNTAARFCANAPAYHLLIGQPTYDACKDYIAVDMVPGVQLKGKSAETFRIYQVTAIRETPTSPWVPFPTEMALQQQDTFTQQYTHKTILGNVNSTSRDILVGEEAQEVLAEQAATAPTPPYGTQTYGTPVQGPEETPTPAGL
jgi:Adenylate cyclase, family 3 (some proteins contain HAMP domain)